MVYPAIEAAQIESIVPDSVVSKSGSVCWAERPWVSAREKLAIMPVF